MPVKEKNKMLLLITKALNYYREDEKGQTMTEYALILAAIAIVVVVAYNTLGTTITTQVNKIVACL
jgi:Flp pilus assembly pilin Flp